MAPSLVVTRRFHLKTKGHVVLLRQQTPIFVVSSGRAGSTLLAKMIQRHPRLLCVSDIFEPVGEIPYFDRQRLVDGKAFFAVLSSPSFKQRIKYWREQPTGELLFLPEDDDQVSLLLSYALPFLVGGDPMPLYEELEQAFGNRGDASMADHLIYCFDWLRERFGRDLWVERTGGSLPHMRKIIETWPDAKIIHNFRDTRETAISMMTGSFFRLYLELEKNPNLGDWDSTYMPPVEEMGAMLNRWIVDAVDALEAVPEDRKLDLSFEQLITDTSATLQRFSEFVFDSEPTAEEIAWAEAECAVIRPPKLKFPALPEEQQDTLEEACAAGLEALGYPLAEILAHQR